MKNLIVHFTNREGLSCADPDPFVQDPELTFKKGLSFLTLLIPKISKA